MCTATVGRAGHLALTQLPIEYVEDPFSLLGEGTSSVTFDEEVPELNTMYELMFKGFIVLSWNINA